MLCAGISNDLNHWGWYIGTSGYILSFFRRDQLCSASISQAVRLGAFLALICAIAALLEEAKCFALCSEILRKIPCSALVSLGLFTLPLKVVDGNAKVLGLEELVCTGMTRYAAKNA